MTKQQCSGCVHWDRESSDRAYHGVRDLGRCRAAIMLWDATEWVEDNDPPYDRMLKPEYRDTMMFVSDASDYYAQLMTRSDFCCSQFRPAE